MHSPAFDVVVVGRALSAHTVIPALQFTRKVPTLRGHSLSKATSKRK
jgi:cation diffusion facilitator CzcD-associated flavoprotein CzcO